MDPIIPLHPNSIIACMYCSHILDSVDWKGCTPTTTDREYALSVIKLKTRGGVGDRRGSILTPARLRCCRHLVWCSPCCLCEWYVVPPPCPSFHLLPDQGQVFTWGEGRHGQLGQGTTNASSTPVEVKFDSEVQPRIVKVACGQRHTLALSGASLDHTLGIGPIYSIRKRSIALTYNYS